MLPKATPPPADFERAELEIETIPPGRTFGRVYWGAYPDPLGYGKSPSRFSDPRRRVDANRFGVLYLGDSLKVCFLEAVLRDRREGLVDDLPVDEAELTQRRYAEIATIADLRLRAMTTISSSQPSVATVTASLYWPN
jgi:hypothetical protein